MVNPSLARRAAWIALPLIMATIAWRASIVMQGSGVPDTELTKTDVLRNLAKCVIAPGYADLESKCRALSKSIARLEKDPQTDLLQEARRRWIDAALSAQKLECFKIEPAVDGGYAAAFYFWPVRPASIERAIRSERHLSQPQVEELGAAAKGLFAIEYLLFSSGDEGSRELLGVDAEPRRRYLSLISNDLADQAGTLAKDWQPPLSPSAKRFVEGGQTSINLLVNRMAWTLEHVGEAGLRPLVTQGGKGQRRGAASGIANRLLLASVQGVERFYSAGEGVGFDDYLKHLGSPVAGRMAQQFDQTTAELGRLERAPVSTDPITTEILRASYASCHALELVVKVDLTSALGVTLTFSPIDGD